MNSKTKILNLYAGIGGNRKLWEDCEVTAVEINPKIAAIYQDNFPDDKMIVGDAHNYLLHHYADYDFIWSSPPCPSHSDIRRSHVYAGQNKAIYPEMDLYAEIIFLQNYAAIESRWVIENVMPYYKPLVNPTVKIQRHLFWSNFYIRPIRGDSKDIVINEVEINKSVYGFNISAYKLKHRKDQILRNLVNPKIGLYIYNCSKKETTQLNLFK